MAGSRKYIRLVLFFVNFLDVIAVKGQSEIVISQGRIIGTTLTSRKGRNFGAFLGIPYAQPPVGSLRFKNPVPADSWNGTLVADSEENICPQIIEDGQIFGDEDCLYLNVYTPETSPNVLYPTIVYIHGGAFVKGNGGPSGVAPGFIMDKDVVLVAMNYRLGVLGFLSTGDLAASGNFGLKDQALALRWVKQNVAAFGGDPDRVTLIGHSAGGASVNLHALSKSSAELFHQYVTLSGSSLCFWAFRDISSYKELSVELGNYFNCSTNDSQAMIDCLREIDAHDLIDTEHLFGGFLNLISTWTPTNEPEHENAFLTSTPIDRMLENKVADYPWISSNVADEGLVVTAPIYADEESYEMISQNISYFLRFIAEKYLGVENPNPLTEEVLKFYFADAYMNDKKAFFKSLTNLITDAAFLFPAVLHMQVALKKKKTPFYYYSFEYRGTYSETEIYMNSTENIGISHSDNMLYIFPIDPKFFHSKKVNMSESDNRIIDVMVDFWASFAYNGTPSSSQLSNPYIWEPYDKDMTYLQIGRESYPGIALKRNFRLERMRFWLMQILKINFRKIFSR